MKRAFLVSALAMIGSAVNANEFRPAMEAYLSAELMSWVNDPVIVAAIKDQNALTSGYDQAQIDEMDQTWRGEVGNADSALISNVLSNAAADFLRDRVAASAGAITEAFAMDAQGLNVAASAVTSDYWQGDEAKFQETFPAGPGSVHISEIEFDESSQTYQGQISIVIVDPADNSPIGAITVGVDAEALM